MPQMNSDKITALEPERKLTHWISVERCESDHAPEEKTVQTSFDLVDLTCEATGKRPGALLEAASFVEQSVQEHGGTKAGLSRRDFLKIGAAAAGFVTAGCALRPTEKIIPYVKGPEEIIPGVPNYYASTSGRASGVGVLVKTREGRPIKLEGNPDHPLF